MVKLLIEEWPDNCLLSSTFSAYNLNSFLNSIIFEFIIVEGSKKHRLTKIKLFIVSFMQTAYNKNSPRGVICFT